MGKGKSNGKKYVAICNTCGWNSMVTTHDMYLQTDPKDASKIIVVVLCNDCDTEIKLSVPQEVIDYLKVQP